MGGRVDQTKYFKWFLLLAVTIFAVRSLLPRLLDKSVYRGPWYTVKVPEGWEKNREEEEVVFISPEKEPATGAPYAIFSIYGMQSKSALFLDDLFIDILDSFSKQKGVILDKGEIKIDGIVSKWILFRNEDPPWVVLSFYLVDDWNRFTKIQYFSHPDKFNAYRSQFEAFKESMRFKQFF